MLLKIHNQTACDTLTTWLNEVNTWGSIASIIGLLVTIKVALSIKDIRSRAALKGRLPAYIKDIRAAAKNLSSLLNSDDLDISSAELILRKLFSSLKSLRKKSSKDLKSSSTTLFNKIKKMKSNQTEITKANIRTAYNEITSFEADLDNYKKDEDWRTQ